jgi:cysteinyl-tRNA synthetase
MPYLRALSTFRDSVRQLAITKGDGAAKEILALCDKLRDSDLVPLGVALDDQEGSFHNAVANKAEDSFIYLLLRGIDGKALVKLVPPVELIKARDEKRAQLEAKAASKAAAVEAERQKRLKKLEKGRIPAAEMFRPPNVSEGTYGSWTEDGIPLTDGEGNELRKNAGKKVRKEHAEQKKLHEDYLAWKKEAA